MNFELESNQKPEVQKLGKLIKGIKIAMLTTVDKEGCLYSRPMMTQEAEFDGTLWFFTGRATGKVDELQHDYHVNLSYSSPDDNRYISVSGNAQLVEDKEKIKELWNPALKAWFPKGVDDPNVILLKVDVERAEYWDSPSGAMVQLFGFAKAVLTGQTYKPSPSEHSKINLQH